MLRRKRETLNEELLQRGQAAGGSAGAGPPRPPAKRSGSARVGTALLVAGVLWLLLGAAFTLWGVWDYNHTELRTVTITRVATVPTAGGDDCDFSSLPGEPAGQWSGDCPPGAAVGRQVELFINPDGMVWDSAGSMAAVIAVSGAVTAFGALVLVGLGWFLRHPPQPRPGPAGPRFGSWPRGEEVGAAGPQPLVVEEVFSGSLPRAETQMAVFGVCGAFFFAFLVFSVAVVVADWPEVDPVLAACVLGFALVTVFCVVWLAGVRRQRTVITADGVGYTTLFGSARVLWSEVDAVESVSALLSDQLGNRWFDPRIRVSRTGLYVRLMRFRTFRDERACDEVCRLLLQHLPGGAAMGEEKAAVSPAEPNPSVQPWAHSLPRARPRGGMTRRAKRAIAALAGAALLIGGALAVAAARSTDSEPTPSAQPTSTRAHGPAPWIIDAAGDAYCAGNPSPLDELDCLSLFATGAEFAVFATTTGGIDSKAEERRAAESFPNPDEAAVYMEGVMYVLRYTEDDVPDSYPENVR